MTFLLIQFSLFFLSKRKNRRKNHAKISFLFSLLFSSQKKKKRKIEEEENKNFSVSSLHFPFPKKEEKNDCISSFFHFRYGKVAGMKNRNFYLFSCPFSASLSYLERGIEGEREEEKILFSFFFLGEEIKEEKERQLLMSENKRLGGQGKNNAREVWRK